MIHAIFLAITNKEKDKVLIFRRHGGRVGFVGGKAESGESVEQALFREVYEEIGFKVSSAQYVCHNRAPNLTTLLFTTALSDSEIQDVAVSAKNAVDYNKHLGLELIPVSELPNLIGAGTFNQQVTELRKKLLTC